jgi:EamA domain-containing membrane protein RarD
MLTTRPPKPSVLRITYEMGRTRLVVPALSGIVNSCVLLIPFCILHLVSANAEGKFMKQLTEF